MIALDIDGVIANLIPEVIYRAKKEGFKIDKSVINNHNILLENVSDKITFNWIKSHFDDPTFWRNAIPFEDAWYWINHHYAKGIICITHRPQTTSCENATWRWFNDWDLFVDDIVHCDHKHDIINDRGTAIFVEDTWLGALHAAEYTNSKVYILNREYNQGIHKKIERINSLWEINI